MKDPLCVLQRARRPGKLPPSGASLTPYVARPPLKWLSWRALLPPLQRYQKILDDLVPLTTLRWVATAAIGVLYMVRVLWLQGWYIVSYALAIYLLNLFIAFLTPRFDPAQREEQEIGRPCYVCQVAGSHSVAHRSLQRMGLPFQPVLARSSNPLSGDCRSSSSGQCLCVCEWLITAA